MFFHGMIIDYVKVGGVLPMRPVAPFQGIKSARPRGPKGAYVYRLEEVNFIQGMLDFGNAKNSLVQQGRNNAPVLAIKIHQ